MEVFGLGADIEETCDEFAFGGDALVHVPDHGPVTDKRGVEAVRNDPTYILDEAPKSYNAERIAVNVATLYREFSDDTTPPKSAELFALMGEIWKERRG